MAFTTQAFFFFLVTSMSPLLSSKKGRLGWAHRRVNQRPVMSSFSPASRNQNGGPCLQVIWARSPCRPAGLVLMGAPRQKAKPGIPSSLLPTPTADRAPLGSRAEDRELPGGWSQGPGRTRQPREGGIPPSPSALSCALRVRPAILSLGYVLERVRIICPLIYRLLSCGVTLDIKE